MSLSCTHVNGWVALKKGKCKVPPSELTIVGIYINILSLIVKKSHFSMWKLQYNYFWARRNKQQIQKMKMRMNFEFMTSDLWRLQAFYRNLEALIALSVSEWETDGWPFLICYTYTWWCRRLICAFYHANKYLWCRAPLVQYQFLMSSSAATKVQETWKRVTREIEKLFVEEICQQTTPTTRK